MYAQVGEGEERGRSLQPMPGQHVLYPPAPQGYASPATIDLASGRGETTAAKASAKAGAYGGSELGSMIGGAVGPPVIGNIVGNLVGERIGEAAIRQTGLDKVASRTGDKLAVVIGRHNVDKVGDIALTAFGYSAHEECLCCPCLPASQVLLVVTLPFFFFNFYKLGVGVSYESSCSYAAPNATYVYNTTDDVPDVYPCEFGFYYLVVSSAVWLSLLPFWICGLFGNCWRQCCCCCCDPVVLGATIIDLLKRCCCECGKVNLCEMVWLAHCLFHIGWAAAAVSWLAGLQLDHQLIEFRPQIQVAGWQVPAAVVNCIIASVVFDLLLCGSEVFHRIRRMTKKDIEAETVEMTEQRQDLNPAHR